MRKVKSGLILKTHQLNRGIAGMVVLYQPPTSVLKNILSYITPIEKLYVIDNSTSHDQKLIEQLIQIDKVVYINNNGNKGIANALNQGCKQAIIEGFNWILTMDQDSSFNESEVSRFIDSVKIPGNLDIERVGVFSPCHVVNDRNIVTLDSEYEQIKVAMTSGNILNLNIFLTIGGFEEKLFIDYVDHEYCLRVRRYGYKVLQCNRIHLQHHLGDSIRYAMLRMTATHHNFIRRYYITRNRFYVIWTYKYFEPTYCIKEFILSITDLVKIAMVEQDKLRKLRSVIRGIKDFLGGRYGRYA